MNNETLNLEADIVKTLKNIHDPEIPVNIYDLGLIYEIKIDEEMQVEIVMTMTSPNCPMADDLLNDVYEQTGKIPSVKKVKVQLTFDPPWDQDRMTEEAKLDLGFL
ncbi:MAG: FeS assembly SUF system protein [Bacteroidetes bacterium RIFOXYA12_FULL_35_11]|nr:MAG: FeS assembly SUF system protein [Bacteroidetes bacterium GWF2_35_48]OFY79542.1 MAG: FeS assembly SUF system protein [Bacteroidetes bacterium RIFOXYA12_FULL_35_11]OFY92735.1 MAG: FeS assembly SUF system protein [Bacteroidetes bacterium RIFOXYC12_FULL_35_7]OFY94954.1 MAG: FeS assembly SUF system protein [Bacteroidetes bacterium RIFOXYB2_FULL_35_7]HBX53445.1 FeS assembly SUF system protein [Bacteroidales bacterium]